MDTVIKQSSRLANWLYGLTLFALISGICLSVLAWMNLCTEACSAGHKYRLYGIAFEPIGIAFFSVALLVFVLSKWYSLFRLIGCAMVFGALGAELTFTYAQKALIGHWCPICLSIASTVVVVIILLTIDYIREFCIFLSHKDKGGVMKSYIKAFCALLMIITGFAFSQIGFAKFNQLYAMEKEIKDKLAFGSPTSTVEVYVFTDWKCQSCRKIEPILQAAFPKITAKAKVVFVDFPVHEESLNFTPFNLSFMINNKKDYFKLRDFLTELSRNTNTPTEKEIADGAQKAGTTFKPLNYSDVASGIKYFDHLVTQFDLEGTPMIVVVNGDNKKGKKLSGIAEISEKSIMNAIDTIGAAKN